MPRIIKKTQWILYGGGLGLPHNIIDLRPSPCLLTPSSHYSHLLKHFLRSPHPLAVVESATMMCHSQYNNSFRLIAPAALHSLPLILLRAAIMNCPSVASRKQALLCWKSFLTPFVFHACAKGPSNPQCWMPTSVAWAAPISVATQPTSRYAYSMQAFRLT